MKFTVQTKPLNDALSLGIINSNVSNYYLRSTLAELSVIDQSNLVINLEAASIYTELSMKGSVDNFTGRVTACVDCRLLKQLVSTFESKTTVIEFTDSCVILHSANSKFTLPLYESGDSVNLNRPNQSTDYSSSVPLSKESWKFVKDHQTYALAMSQVMPIYMFLWCGEDGTLLVGDFENSLFTMSGKSNLHDTCLLSSTVVNLFNNLPENSTLSKLDKSYIVRVSTDSFKFMCEFFPKYEGDEGVGSYNSDIIIDVIKSKGDTSFKVNSEQISKILNQSSILNSSDDALITMTVKPRSFMLKDESVELVDEVDYTGEKEYSVKFKKSRLRSVFYNLPEGDVKLSLILSDEGELDGIVLIHKDVSVTVAGEE